jgi:hypothetical protein
MFTIIILLTLFIVLDIAALRWGTDSTENFTSCEWDRRRRWNDHVDDQLAVD